MQLVYCVKGPEFRLQCPLQLRNSGLAGVVVVVLVAFSYVILSLKILPVSGKILGSFFVDALSKSIAFICVHLN